MSADAPSSNVTFEKALQLQLEKRQVDAIRGKLTTIPSDGNKACFPECTCLALFKRGKYNEGACEAHKLTLRTSKPHPYMLCGVLPQSTLSTTKVLGHSQSAPAITPLSLPLSPIQTSTPALSLTKKPKSKQGKRATTPGEDATNASTQSARRRRKSSHSQRRSNSKDESSDRPTKVLPSLQNADLVVSPQESRSVDILVPAHKTFYPLQSIVLRTEPMQLETQHVVSMFNQYSKLIGLHAEPPRDMAVVYTRRSTLLAAFGQYEAAIRDAEEAIRLDPTASVGYFRLGFALFGIHRFAEASAAFQRGLTVDVHSLQLRHALNATLARVRHHCNQTKFE